jgi:hypothetical protein
MTKINFTYPWGLIRRNGNRLLCADNIVRAAELAQCADTYFSIPASIRIKGKRITGYATSDESNGERVWIFRPMDIEKNAYPFLAWKA